MSAVGNPNMVEWCLEDGPEWHRPLCPSPLLKWQSLTLERTGLLESVLTSLWTSMCKTTSKLSGKVGLFSYVYLIHFLNAWTWLVMEITNPGWLILSFILIILTFFIFITQICHNTMTIWNITQTIIAVEKHLVLKRQSLIMAVLSSSETASLNTRSLVLTISKF